MTSFSKIALVAAAAVGALGIATASQAAVTTTSSLAGWEAAMGTWAETTNYGPEGSAISSFTTGDGVGVGLSVPADIAKIGSSWATWSGGYTGEVLWAPGNQSVTYTLANPVKGFGVFAEPDTFDVFNITLQTSDGQTLSQDVNGSGGAAFFGWTGSGVTSFTLTTTDSDFAAGDFFSAAGGAVPEPSAWAMMLVGFGGLGAMMRKVRRQAVATA